MKSTHGGCKTSFLLSKFIYRKSYLSTIEKIENILSQSGSSREQGLERLAWIDRGTCAPLPFHVTGGQPAVGQGVVVHARGLCLES
ncbi:unnamed protein product [Spirodela intermedia]|uniref:Uncharacterized protein n=1 Tax=Spirodela intermedia TaxID=51605 RepID=A0A7I8IGZ5_SPIIN|nr:unnamed protein product [Spirodela intermedia]CAA6656564.1 unnamed protein product [Spirodela intermedia]